MQGVWPLQSLAMVCVQGRCKGVITSARILTDPVVVEETPEVPELPPRVITFTDEPGLDKGLEVLFAKVTHSGIILWRRRRICSTYIAHLKEIHHQYIP